MAHSENLIHDGVRIGENRRVDPASVSPEVLEALEKFNQAYQASPEAFYDDLDASVHTYKGRLPYLLLHQPGDSKTHVALSQPPYATNIVPHAKNPNSYNTVVKTSLLDLINRYRGLTDPEGNFVSTMVVAGPDRDYRPHFSPREHRRLAAGDFSPYAKRIFEVMKSVGFETALIYGYSRASAVGSTALKEASVHNVDAPGAVLAEPTDAERQSVLKFMVDYLANYAPDRRPGILSGHWWNDGPQVMLDLQEQYGDGSYIGNFLRPSTIPTIFGMAKNELLGNITDAMRLGKMVVAAYGENSGVAYKFGRTVSANPDLQRFAGQGLLKVVKVGGPATGHDWGENHLAYAATFSDGLLEVAGR